MSMPTATEGTTYPLRVVTYHRIADQGAPPDLDPSLVSATPEAFRKQILHLRKRYHPVGLAEVEDAFLRGRPLPPRAVHVTFDDAYRDFAECAWPVLRDLDVPVTVFVPTAYPDQPTRTLWWDRLHRAALLGSREDAWQRAIEAAAAALDVMPTRVEDPREVRGLLRDLPHHETELFVDNACKEMGLEEPSASSDGSTVLSWDELRRLKSEGVAFGVHTRHHASLPNLEEVGIRAEIQGSIEDLTRELGGGPWPIAYPYGIYDREVMRITKEEGCTLGFTCDDGLNETGSTDPFALRRTNITLRTSPAIFAVRMLPWFAEIDRWRHREERERYAH